MAQYCITYFGGDHPSDPEEGKKHFAAYMEWISSMGSAAVSPMNPLKDTHTINPDGSLKAGGSSTMSGYSIVEADSMDNALTMAKACPFLGINGTLEVSELVQMPNR